MSTHWNYRILAKKIKTKSKITPLDVKFGIYEVHYKDDVPTGCTQDEVYPVAFNSDIEDQVESIKWQLNAMLAACDKPVLDYDDFPKEYIKYSRKQKLNKIKKDG